MTIDEGDTEESGRDRLQMRKMRSAKTHRISERARNNEPAPDGVENLGVIAAAGAVCNLMVSHL